MKLRTRSTESILQLVRKRAKELQKTLSPKAFFQSEDFIRFATKTTAVIVKARRTVYTTFSYEPKSETVAYTDGNHIVVNTGNVLAESCTDLKTAMDVNMGICFHECAHKLFLDFPGENRAIREIEGGTVYGKEPQFTDPKMSQNWDEIKQTIAAPGYGSVMASLYHKLSNIISDGRDEEKMKIRYPGYVARCINAAGEIQIQTATPVDDLVGKVPDFEIYFGMILLYAKYGVFKYTDANAVQQYLTGINPLLNHVEWATDAKNTKEKFLHLSYILCYLWDSIKEMLENTQQQNQNSQGQSSQGQSQGAGQPTPDQMQQAISDAVSGATKAGNAATAPVNCKHKAISSTDDDPDSDDTEQPSESAAQVLQKESEAVAQEEVQQEMDKEMRDYLRKLNLPPEHANVPVYINRVHGGDSSLYDDFSQEVTPLAKSLAVKMSELLKQINDKNYQRHKIYGRRMVATDCHREDGRWFAQKKLPQDLPNMAIAVLCDESGSMSGERMTASMKAMILLEKFATYMGIPSLMAGHYLRNKVVLNVYSDFSSAMQERDRRGLGAITAHGCNHDGIPIRFVGNLLAERQETVKLLFVISDGSPNGVGNYGGTEAFRDIQKAIKELSARGVTVYGCAIGDDEEAIKEIYGKGFLNLTNLRSMPKTLLRLVSQKIV